MSDLNLLNTKTSAETETTLLLEAVDAGIKAMTKALSGSSTTARGSVGDLIRLLQLRKELADEQPRHITVRWIGEDECSNSTD